MLRRRADRSGLTDFFLYCACREYKHRYLDGMMQRLIGRLFVGMWKATRTICAKRF